MDNPGFMLGPKAERAGIARHHARPLMAQVHRTRAAVPRPRPQGLRARPDGDGRPVPADRPAPRLADGRGRRHGPRGRRRADPAQQAPPDGDDDGTPPRDRRDELAAKLRESSLAINAARRYAYDEVIDPAETRDRIIRMLDLLPPPPHRNRKKHYIDTW